LLEWNKDINDNIMINDIICTFQIRFFLFKFKIPLKSKEEGVLEKKFFDDGEYLNAHDDLYQINEKIILLEKEKKIEKEKENDKENKNDDYYNQVMTHVIISNSLNNANNKKQSEHISDNGNY
jgi:hypothetical protein